MLKISVYSTQNLDKSYDQMNDKEKMVYYFLNCRDNGKTKMIENDEVIQTVEKRVETISNDCWKKIIEDFQKVHENEERMELQLELEEAHKAQEEADKKVSQMSQEIKQMIQDMLSNGMSVSQIAKCVSKSEEEILELIC
ncbi:hypothetical protein [Holdemanella biformis]|uniref:hypothetical protein n=1 Tax=Holdemanella biformis TaxID=1735 RepID=UPI00265E90F2|nr:hypothetical protein [Holdemanella biformis]